MLRLRTALAAGAERTGDGGRAVAAADGVEGVVAVEVECRFGGNFAAVQKTIPLAIEEPARRRAAPSDRDLRRPRVIEDEVVCAPARSCVISRTKIQAALIGNHSPLGGAVFSGGSSEGPVGSAEEARSVAFGTEDVVARIPPTAS